MPWTQDLWLEEVDETGLTMEAQCIPHRFIKLQDVNFRAPDFSTENERIIFCVRLACKYWIDELDPRGLPEVYKSLKEFVEYYRPAETSVHLLPDTAIKHAIVNSRTVSPAFEFEEE